MIKENPKIAILVAYLTYFLGLLCQVGFNFVIFKQFSLEDVGTYSFIISVAAFAGFSLDLGISQTLIRGFSQNQVNFAQALVGSLVLRLPIFGLGIIIFFLWLRSSTWENQVLILPLVLAVLSQFFIAFRAIPSSWLRAQDRQNMANAITVLQPIGYFSVCLALIFLQSFTLLSFFGGTFLVEIGVTSLAFLALGKIDGARNLSDYLNFSSIKQALSALWKPGVIFTVVGFGALIQSRLDWIMVYSYVSKTDLAYYSLANRVFELFEAGICVVIQTAFPWMCKVILPGEKNPKAILSLKTLAYLGMILAFLSALTVPHLLKLFWGEKFAKADHLIFLLMCGAALSQVTSILYYLFIVAGKERYFLITTTIPTLLQVAANIILIPRYGGLGATVSMLLLFFSSFVLLSFYSLTTRLFEFIDLYKVITIFVIFSIAVLLFKLFLDHNIVTSILFIVLMSVTGAVFLYSKNERSFIYSHIVAVRAYYLGVR